MVFVHTQPPGQAIGGGREAHLFGTTDLHPAVPKAGQGYSGNIDTHMPMNILTYCGVTPQGYATAPSGSVYASNSQQPYVIAIGQKRWLIVGVAQPRWPYIPDGGSAQLYTGFYWEIVTRNNDGTLTRSNFGTAAEPWVTVHMPADEAQELELFQWTNTSNDGTVCWTGMGATAYVRSGVFNADYTSMSFADFVLPYPFQTALFYPSDPRVTTPNAWFNGPPMVVSKTLAFQGMTPVRTTYTNYLSYGTIFSFNPSTGTLIDTFNYPGPTPHVPMCALFPGLNVIASGLDSSHIYRIPINANGTFGTPVTHATTVTATDFGAYQGQYGDVRFWGPGYLTNPSYQPAQNNVNTYFTFDDTNTFAHYPAPAQQCLNHSSGDYAGATSPLNDQNVFWQQTAVDSYTDTVFGQPPGNTTYTRFDWQPSALGGYGTPLTSTVQVPTACTNPDGTYPITQPAEGGFPPWRGTMDGFDNVLWYNPLPPDPTGNFYSTTTFTVW